MSSLFGAAKGAFESDQAHEKTKKTRTSSADVVMWSGCKDSQTVGSFFFPCPAFPFLVPNSFFSGVWLSSQPAPIPILDPHLFSHL